jgi:hypothetical protein
LEENLRALVRQNFPRYEVVFVVDSERDAAVPVIEKIINGKDAETPTEILENSAFPRFCG